jgi:hypothetical protein
MRRLVQQLEVDELPTQGPGELRRMHMRGAPPEQYSVMFAPADRPPPTYPSDLPWLAGVDTSLMCFGPNEPLLVLWSCADAAAAADRIIAESLADGWTELPGFRFPTATGARITFLERAGARRTVQVSPPAGRGVVQLMQTAQRADAGP